MVIRILSLVGGADTRDQGTVLCDALKASLESSDVVVVSFDSVDIATSSFVNASFVALLSWIPFHELKRRVRVVDATKQISDMIKQRVSREASLLAA